jgi:hypothetical protein
VETNNGPVVVEVQEEMEWFDIGAGGQSLPVPYILGVVLKVCPMGANWQLIL